MEREKTSEKNIILITIDCLRGDHLHCMGYPKNITPTLDNLAANGILFKTAIANAPYTPYSVPSFLTSTLPPIKKGNKKTITEVLKKNGYSTATFNPNPIILSSIAVPGSRLDKDFDCYDLMLSNVKRYGLVIEETRQVLMKYLRLGLKEKSVIYKIIYFLYDIAIKSFPTILSPKQHHYIPLAEELNKHAINWIKNQKNKYFLWLHYMDVHEPYAPPNYENQKELMYLIAKYRDFPNMLTKNEIQKLINLYDLEIKYTDKAINSFIQELKKMGHYDNSIIIISADHGDAFGEHDTLGHGGKFRAQLYEEVIHVPLIISGHNKKGITIDRQVQLLGLAPTICELINIQSPPHFFGKSFFAKTQEKGMIANSSACIAYRTKKYKFIINKLDNKEKELYDLENDPEEKRNIYKNNRIVADRQESEMLNLLEKEKKKRNLMDIKLNFK